MMVMEDMLKDFLLGEHLLLVGNQVGKQRNLWPFPFYFKVDFLRKSPVEACPLGLGLHNFVNFQCLKMYMGNDVNMWGLTGFNWNLKGISKNPTLHHNLC